MKKALVIGLALALCVALAAPAMAKFVVGGKMLTSIGVRHTSDDMNSSGTDITDTFIGVAVHSRLFATFINAAKDTGGHIEFGIMSYSGGNSVSLRHIYGWYKMGNVKFLAGHTDNWTGTLAFAISNNVAMHPDAGMHLLMIGWGSPYLNRRPMVQMTWMSGNVGLQFALASPTAAGAAAAGITGQAYNAFPEVNLALQIRVGGLAVIPSFMYTRHDYEGVASGDDSAQAWLVSLPGKFNFGGFSIRFAIHYGSNLGIANLANLGSWASPVMKADGSLEDTTNVGGQIGIHYTYGRCKFIAGFGFEHYDNTEWEANHGKGGTSRKAYILAFQYTVNKHFRIIPELGIYHHGDNPITGAGLGTEWVLGAEIQFSF